MHYFYHTDQSEDESIPSFATWIEGLLSQIWDRFGDKLPHQEEQRLLWDHLFHGCKKSIPDSVKFCFADPCLDYMHFLEECRKAYEEGKVGQAKTVTKAKVAAATVPTTKDDDLSKELKYQQHEIDALLYLNPGKQCVVPPSLGDWYRHSQFKIFCENYQAGYFAPLLHIHY